ncbi:hypothetical protein CR513_40448, partial [Mucuna pruriens]
MYGVLKGLRERLEEANEFVSYNTALNNTLNTILIWCGRDDPDGNKGTIPMRRRDERKFRFSIGEVREVAHVKEYTTKARAT